MNVEEARYRLKSEIEPLVANVFLADQAYDLLKTSGDFAESLNLKSNNFGNLFGFLQSLFSDKFILSVTKIFEKQNSRYPTHSIPVVISLLEEYKDTLPITQRATFLRTLDNVGLRIRANELAKLSDSDLKIKVVDHFKTSLPDISRRCHRRL